MSEAQVTCHYLTSVASSLSNVSMSSTVAAMAVMASDAAVMPAKTSRNSDTASYRTGVANSQPVRPNQRGCTCHSLILGASQALWKSLHGLPSKSARSGTRSWGCLHHQHAFPSRCRLQLAGTSKVKSVSDKAQTPSACQRQCLGSRRTASPAGYSMRAQICRTLKRTTFRQEPFPYERLTRAQCYCSGAHLPSRHMHRAVTR